MVFYVSRFLSRNSYRVGFKNQDDQIWAQHSFWHLGLNELLLDSKIGPKLKVEGECYLKLGRQDSTLTSKCLRGHNLPIWESFRVWIGTFVSKCLEYLVFCEILIRIREIYFLKGIRTKNLAYGKFKVSLVWEVSKWLSLQLVGLGDLRC